MQLSQGMLSFKLDVTDSQRAALRAYARLSGPAGASHPPARPPPTAPGPDLHSSDPTGRGFDLWAVYRDLPALVQALELLAAQQKAA